MISLTSFSALLHAEDAYFRVNRLEPQREDVYEMASCNCVRMHILSQDASIRTCKMQRHRANKLDVGKKKNYARASFRVSLNGDWLFVRVEKITKHATHNRRLGNKESPCMHHASRTGVRLNHSFTSTTWWHTGGRCSDHTFKQITLYH